MPVYKWEIRFEIDGQEYIDYVYSCLSSLAQEKIKKISKRINILNTKRVRME